VELQSRVEELRAKGIGLAAISYDSREVLAAFGSQRGIGFPLLSDEGSATIRRYGILNPVPEMALGPNRDDPAVKALVETYVSVVNPSAEMVGIAFPGTFMLDTDGRVTSRFFEDFYIQRNTVSSVMLRLGEGTPPVAATKVSTEHFDLTTYSSDPVLAAGNRVTLALAIVPKPNIHMYAPGAADYRVVGLKLQDLPFIRALPMQYPDSEIYHFKPLDERVPVYQKPFTLLQEVILEGSREAQAVYRGRESLTLTGTLEYQACDDEICFNPASVPLSWTVELRPLVVQRTVPRE
jgi:peroxiredoxin